MKWVVQVLTIQTYQGVIFGVHFVELYELLVDVAVSYDCSNAVRQPSVIIGDVHEHFVIALPILGPPPQHIVKVSWVMRQPITKAVFGAHGTVAKGPGAAFPKSYGCHVCRIRT